MSVPNARIGPKAAAGNARMRYLAAALAFTSQAIHLWLLPETFVVTLLPGLSFLLVGIGQGLLGVSLLFGPGRWALRSGVSLNLVIVTVWSITRIVRLPALTGSAQLTVDTLGVVAVIAEISVVVLLLGLLAGKR